MKERGSIMSNKERKGKNEISFGLVLGIDIIAITWALLIIPALLIQSIGIEQTSSTYTTLMAIFQIIAAFLATLISIKISLKSSYLANNDISKAMITGIISISILTIINYIIGNLLPIIPFGNLLGLIIILAVYAVSHYSLRKLYE